MVPLLPDSTTWLPAWLMVLPMYWTELAIWVLLCIVISCFRFWFCRMPCSTPVNCTSCGVPCVESIGDSGSCWWSCAVSRVRDWSNLLLAGASGRFAGGFVAEVAVALLAVVAFWGAAVGLVA